MAGDDDKVRCLPGRRPEGKVVTPSGKPPGRVSYGKNGNKKIRYEVNLDELYEYRLMSFPVFRAGKLVLTVTYYVPVNVEFYPCPGCVERGVEKPTRICRGIDLCPDCQYESGEFSG